MHNAPLHGTCSEYGFAENELYNMAFVPVHFVGFTLLNRKNLKTPGNAKARSRECTRMKHKTTWI